MSLNPMIDVNLFREQCARKAWLRKNAPDLLAEVGALKARIAELEAENARLKGEGGAVSTASEGKTTQPTRKKAKTSHRAS